MSTETDTSASEALFVVQADNHTFWYPGSPGRGCWKFSPTGAKRYTKQEADEIVKGFGSRGAKAHEIDVYKAVPEAEAFDITLHDEPDAKRVVRYLVKCAVPGEGMYGHYAIVTFGLGRRYELLRRREEFLASKGRDNDLDAMRYRDFGGVDYYDDMPFAVGLEGEALQEFDYGSVIELDDTYQVMCEPTRMYSNVLVLDESGIWWESRPDSSTLEVSTPLLSWEQILNSASTST